MKELKILALKDSASPTSIVQEGDYSVSHMEMDVVERV